MEAVVTDGRHVIVNDARSHSCCRSNRLQRGVLVDGYGVVAEQVAETERGPVLQGLVTLMGSYVEIAEVGSGRGCEGPTTTCRDRRRPYGTREAKTGFQARKGRYVGSNSSVERLP